MYIFNYEHLDENVIKMYKAIDEEIESCTQYNTDYSYKLLIATLRNNILSIFVKAVDHEIGINSLQITHNY